MQLLAFAKGALVMFWLVAVLNRSSKNVGEAAETRQKQARKRSLRAVNEHSEPVFNAVSATQVVFQRPANLFYPFAAPLQAWLNWAAGLMLLVHMGEALLFQARLQARPQPWLERMQVLLFGFLHLRGLPKA